MVEDGKILVVDDDEDNCMLMEKILQHLGYEADIVNDGEECITYCADNHPKLIFLDISLPNRDGMDVLKELRASSKSCELPIVMFSAHDMKKEALAIGATAFLSKPFVPEDLKKITDQYA